MNDSISVAHETRGERCSAINREGKRARDRSRRNFVLPRPLSDVWREGGGGLREDPGQKDFERTSRERERETRLGRKIGAKKEGKDKKRRRRRRADWVKNGRRAARQEGGTVSVHGWEDGRGGGLKVAKGRMERVNGVGKKRTKDVAGRRRMSSGHGPTRGDGAGGGSAAAAGGTGGGGGGWSVSLTRLGRGVKNNRG